MVYRWQLHFTEKHEIRRTACAQRNPVAYLWKSAGLRIPRKATSTWEKTPEQKRNRLEHDEIGAVPPPGRSKPVDTLGSNTRNL